MIDGEPKTRTASCAPQMDAHGGRAHRAHGPHGPYGGERASRATDAARRRFYSVWAGIGAIALVLAFFYLLTLIPVPVGIVLWSTVIIFCLRRPVNFLERHGLNRVVGTALSYVFLVAVIALLGMLLFSPVFGFGEQFANLAQSIPGYIDSIMKWANDFYQSNVEIFQNDAIMTAVNQAANSLADWASQLASQSAGGLVSVGASVANSVMAIGFAFVVAFWILIELPAMGREVYRIADDRIHDDLRMIHLSFTRVMGGYIRATLLQCTLIGILCGILFAIVGIPNAAALGAITGLLNIIPIVGPWFGGALAAIAGVMIDPIVALVALVGTIALQQFIYTFVSPKIMQESVDVHPIVTILVMMLGSALGGIMAGLVGSLVGMLLSIPLTAVAKALFVYYYEKGSGKRIVSPDGVFFKVGSPSGGEGEGEDVLDPLYDATTYRTADVDAAEAAAEARVEAAAEAAAQAREAGASGEGAEAARGGSDPQGEERGAAVHS